MKKSITSQQSTRHRVRHNIRIHGKQCNTAPKNKANSAGQHQRRRHPVRHSIKVKAPYATQHQRKSYPECGKQCGTASKNEANSAT
ncbi:hypothetical protein DPMN_001827 [Dreissena polymorpha]|uniref:Uncharacterized protein n=1 Tax=Dreissena polymorpha TaxID=45954 RepID=A0A9D4MMF7_DREPO|nr:hypothetical protein DPMN_001827 [Dreissena polymorpha]